MNWNNIWITLFGTPQWLGLSIGFWVSLAVVALIVIVMNLVFWGMKPKKFLLISVDKRISSMILPL